MNKQIIINHGISYTAILVSLISLAISIRSCIREDEAFDWTKKQTELENRISIETNAAWAPGQILISNVAKSNLLGSLRGSPLYSGIDAYLNISIFNNSKYTLTIEKIKWGYLLDSSTLYLPWSSWFIRGDKTDSITYPISLDAKKAITVKTRVPVPVSQDVASKLSGLAKDTVYAPMDLLMRLLAERVIGRPVDNEILYRLIDTMQNIGIYWELQKSASNLPSVLVGMSDPDGTLRRGDRRIEIQYLLASGVTIRDTVDYMDVYTTSMWDDNGVGYFQIQTFLDKCLKIE